MRPYYKAPRLYVEAPFNDSSRNGAEVILTQAQSHYIIHVLRLREEANLLVFNGYDGEWLAQLIAIGKKEVRIRLLHQTKGQTPTADLVYCFAPLKQARLDYMIQKSVEMGAGFLQPVMTRFTQGHGANITRIQANIIEAAQQCGGLSLPLCGEPLKLESLLNNWASLPFVTDVQRQLIFCDEMLSSQNHPLTLLTQLPRTTPLALLIGPEGGFSDEEREILYAQPFVTAIGLGSRILRADTAAVAAMALINAVFDV